MKVQLEMAVDGHLEKQTKRCAHEITTGQERVLLYASKENELPLVEGKLGRSKSNIQLLLLKSRTKHEVCSEPVEILASYQGKFHLLLRRKLRPLRLVESGRLHHRTCRRLDPNMIETHIQCRSVE